MSITQDQYQDVVNKIGDLRVDVASLAGRSDVTNERLNATNDRLDALIKHLDEQARQALSNRKWIIGTFVASASLLATIVGLVIRYMI